MFTSASPIFKLVTFETIHVPAAPGANCKNFEVSGREARDVSPISRQQMLCAFTERARVGSAMRFAIIRSPLKSQLCRRGRIARRDLPVNGAFAFAGSSDAPFRSSDTDRRTIPSLTRGCDCFFGVVADRPDLRVVDCITQGNIVVPRSRSRKNEEARVLRGPLSFLK
jgi:hypothetical protein